MFTIAPAFPDVVWQPTEYVPDIVDTSEEAAFQQHGKIGKSNDNALRILDQVLSGFPNVRPACALNLLDPEPFIASETEKYDLIHIGNTFHVCPRQGIDGFFAIANAVGSQNVRVTIYGPYKRHGQFTTESNRLFSEKLTATNPEFGVRDLESEVLPVAEKHGFQLEKISDVPSNNYFLCFSRL